MGYHYTVEIYFSQASTIKSWFLEDLQSKSAGKIKKPSYSSTIGGPFFCTHPVLTILQIKLCYKGVLFGLFGPFWLFQLFLVNSRPILVKFWPNLAPKSNFFIFSCKSHTYGLQLSRKWTFFCFLDLIRQI